MHILFMDESGTPPKPGPGLQRYFAIGGVIIPEGVWHSVRDDVMGMKLRRKLRGELKWPYFSASNDDPQNPMKALDQPARDAIRTELYGILTKRPSIRAIAAVCSIKAAYKLASINDPQGIYNLTYKVVTERFQYHLQDISRQLGQTQYGLIIADHRQRDDDKRLRAHHQMLVHSTASVTSKYSNLVESLLLQPSNLSIGIQFADMIAGAVWRKFERNDARCYDLMAASLRCRPNGSVDGYGLVKTPLKDWE